MGVVVLAALGCSVGALLTGLAVPSWRHRTWTFTVGGLAGLLAIYLVGRGLAEFWIVDYADPASYRDDWGGPTLPGVLAVHSVPCLLILGAAVMQLRKRFRSAPLTLQAAGHFPRPGSPAGRLASGDAPPPMTATRLPRRS
ncbi:hypothetical protein EBN03_10925 [Nocardia stercoris]|uniref:Uncharacterized protein n=1 Tax=Nocardia stercoris TaxID=2483361 RepID=A0A3M2L969_9NOCA|nr:hypothetical protein EBN03_10925 [Nocardia stercoris]